MYMALMLLFYQNDRSPSSKPKEIRGISKIWKFCQNIS